MKSPNMVFALVLGLGFLASPRAEALPTHPGGYLTQADLNRIRTNVAAGVEPWKSSWAALKNSYVSVSVTPRLGAATNVSDVYALQEDGWKVWVLAVKWVASGDLAYATKAESIIDTWVNQVVSTDVDGLRDGIGANQMANGAEILAWGFGGAAKWPAANVSKAQAWLKRVIYPRDNSAYAANWGTSALSGVMAIAIFCDDHDMFDNAINVYKHGFLPVSQGCCGVTQYIDATGEDAESGRDQGHSQGGIAHLMETALMAWNQQVDLVSYNDDDGILTYGQSGASRIFRGLEWTANYNLGNTVSYHPYYEYCNNTTIYPDGVSATGRGALAPMYEMAVYLFEKAGLTPVHCKEVLASKGYQPESTNSDHSGLGTLLFTQSSQGTGATGGAPGAGAGGGDAGDGGGTPRAGAASAGGAVSTSGGATSSGGAGTGHGGGGGGEVGGGAPDAGSVEAGGSVAIGGEPGIHSGTAQSSSGCSCRLAASPTVSFFNPALLAPLMLLRRFRKRGRCS